MGDLMSPIIIDIPGSTPNANYDPGVYNRMGMKVIGQKPIEQSAAAFSSLANIQSVMTLGGGAGYDVGENALKSPAGVLNVDGAYETASETAHGFGWIEIEAKNPGLNASLGFASAAALNIADASAPKILQNKTFGNTAGTAQIISDGTGAYIATAAYHEYRFYRDTTSGWNALSVNEIIAWTGYMNAVNLRLQVASWNAGDLYVKNFSSNFGVLDTAPELTPVTLTHNVALALRANTFTWDENQEHFASGLAGEAKIATLDATWRTKAEWGALGAEIIIPKAESHELEFRANSAGANPGSFGYGRITPEAPAGGGGGGSMDGGFQK